MTTWSKRCLLLSVIFLITDLAPPVSAYLHTEGGLRIRRGRNIPVRISSLRIVNMVKNENWYCDIIEIERRLIKVVSWEQSEKIIFRNAHHTHQVLRINLVGNTHRVKNRQPSQTPYSPYNYPTGVQVHFSNKLRWCLKNISPAAYLEIWKVWLLAIGRLAACSFSTGSLSSKFDVVSHNIFSAG